MIDLNCFQQFGVNIMKRGKVPGHVAFIMDGNRRHALKQNKQSFKGHEQGAESLKKCLCLCLELGISETSFFCFSIDNFKRTPQEVKKLMDLVIESFNQVSQFYELLMAKEVKVKIIGNIALFPKNVQEALETVATRTEKHSRMQVNLCFAYDSLEEINNSIEECRKNNLSTSESNVFKHLMIQTPVDIMVRTSNESRLSNFLIAQSPFSQICILKENWPEMGFMSFLKVLFEFNLNFDSFSKAKGLWMARLKSQNTDENIDKLMHYSASEIDIEENKKII